jgi:hypothetical protein
MPADFCSRHWPQEAAATLRQAIGRHKIFAGYALFDRDCRDLVSRCWKTLVPRILSKPRLIGAPDKFIFEVPPSRDALPKLLANIWFHLAICNSSGSPVTSMRTHAPVAASKVYFHFPLRRSTRHSLTLARKYARCGRLGANRLYPCQSWRRRDSNKIGDRRGQIHGSANRPETLTSGKEPRIPENEPDIHLSLISVKPWSL